VGWVVLTQGRAGKEDHVLDGQYSGSCSNGLECGFHGQLQAGHRRLPTTTCLQFGDIHTQTSLSARNIQGPLSSLTPLSRKLQRDPSAYQVLKI
jgi:hypothetical protein